MTDTRGGGFALGLAVVSGLALITEVETWPHDQLERSHALADTPVVDLPTGSALVRTDSGWEVVGDAVVHGAARVGVVGSWDDFRSVNVDGPANVELAAEVFSIVTLRFTRVTPLPFRNASCSVVNSWRFSGTRQQSAGLTSHAIETISSVTAISRLSRTRNSRSSLCTSLS